MRAKRCLLYLLAVVITFLAVTLLLDRWVILRYSVMFNFPRVLKVSTLLGGCAGETPSRCPEDKPMISAVNYVPQNTSRKRTVGFSARCTADSVAKLTENVYSDNDRPVHRLPHCIIIGAQKGGTSALREFLHLHPDVRAKEGEIDFFNYEKNYGRGLDWYRRQMLDSHTG